VQSAYDLSASEAELVKLAEAALRLANDETLRASDRLSAMGRFQRLLQQLNFEVPDDGEIETDVDPRSWPRHRRLV
jgi:hypothetical protein